LKQEIKAAEKMKLIAEQKEVLELEGVDQQQQVFDEVVN
jgi:hypothetical protein